jgi:hypothetical protein
MPRRFDDDPGLDQDPKGVLVIVALGVLICVLLGLAWGWR